MCPTAVGDFPGRLAAKGSKYVSTWYAFAAVCSVVLLLRARRNRPPVPRPSGPPAP
ncbi:DUF6629 family protein [Streptomyces sp. NPDC051561]|uniref:DUF6629 family protein n=1 Tax=Streptomyces sp. NPDC051561 TaxID=3365658 RepID=UPI0037A53FA1